MKRTWLAAMLSALVLAAPLNAHAHTDLKPGFNLFSAQQDVQIGQQSAVQVEREIPVLGQPASTRFVQRLGARLAANAPGAKFPYRFKVVNLSDLNAFALPGGYVYVHRGLIEQVRTEGELAGVLAHEIAHIALRHPTNRLSKAYAAQAGAGLVGSLFGVRGGTTTGEVVNALGGFGLNALFLKFSRADESQADALGAQIMARSGYNPSEMANFFAYMRQKAGSDPGRVQQFFSGHPSPADRESHIRTEARQRSVRRASPVGGLSAAKAELRRLAPARSMSQVAPRASLAPRRSSAGG